MFKYQSQLLVPDHAAITSKMDRRIQRLYSEDGNYRVDRWNRYLHDQAVIEFSALDRAEINGTEKVSTYPTFYREIFGRLLSGDELEKHDSGYIEHQWSRKVHKCMDDIPEWKRLCERAKGDTYTTALAAAVIAEATLEAIPKHNEDAKQSSEFLQALLSDEVNGEMLDPELLAQAKENAQKAAQEATEKADGIDGVAVRQAVRKAVSAANGQAEEMDQAVSAYGQGWGTGEGCDGPGGKAAVKAELAKRFKAAPKLREMAKMIGRMRLMAARLQSEKVQYGTSEISDIETGNQIERMLPSELLLAGDEASEAIFFRRYLERSCLQYYLHSKENLQKGPIVVCVDDSGSMSGMPEVWAKSLAVALLDIARRQKRSFAFCTFDTNIRISVNETTAKRLSMGDILSALEFFSGGGTKWPPPLDWALSQIETEGMSKADIVFVTDGICRLDSPKSYKARAKKLGVRIFGIGIGNERPSKQFRKELGKFCDEVFCLSDLVRSSADISDEKALTAVLQI